jgi:hypothetical protein
MVKHRLYSKERTMEYKYETNIKYKDQAEVEVYHWNFKDVALDYLNDCDKYQPVEWKDIKRVTE